MPRNPTGERSLLVWDSFCAYLTETVKEALQQQNIDVAVIASGLTPVLRPLDKCLNKPFKENMRRKYLLWMITGLFKFTPDGRKKVPSRHLVLHWMKQSWREIPEEMVRKSFLTSSISMCLTAPRMTPSMKKSQTFPSKKMRWMKNLIQRAKMSHKLTSMIMQFTTKNKQLL